MMPLCFLNNLDIQVVNQNHDPAVPRFVKDWNSKYELETQQKDGTTSLANKVEGH